MEYKNSTEDSSPLEVDNLIFADHLYTGDESQDFSQILISPGAIALKDGRVAAIGSPEALRKQVSCSKENQFDLKGHILMPGLVNAHAHSAMTLFRGLADDLPLMTWLEEHIWPAESQWVSDAFVASGTRLAIAEMLLSGTTSFTDMYFFPEIVAKEAQHAGMRAFLACPILDFPTPWGKGPEEYLDKTQALITQYSNSPLIKVGFGPHAPYTVSDEPLTQMAELAQTHNTFVQMHVHETHQEVDEAVAHSGLRPLERLDRLGLLNENFQAVHFTAASASDIDTAAAKGMTLVHCPASNLKLASGICPLDEFLKHGVNVAIGTDGAASNNGLDMFNELRLASLLAKVKSANASACPAHTSLQLATSNAGKALAPGREIGKLTVGATADCIAIKTAHELSATPLYHPLSHLVYSLNSHQVNHVWVAGQQVVSNRKLLTLNLEEITQEAIEWQNKIQPKA